MIDALILPAIESSPEVIFDKEKNIFKISGNSFPEDARILFAPIFKWIEKYIEDPNESTVIDFNMRYFNSASAKLILDMLELFATLKESGKNVSIIWRHLDVDEDMQYAGESYAEEAKLDIEYITT